MLSKEFRLPFAGNTKGLKNLYSSPWFLLKSKKNSVGHNRFGVIISASAVRKSTQRHFWKRQILESFRHWPNLQKDFLVIVSPRTENAKSEIVKNELAGISKFLTSDK